MAHSTRYKHNKHANILQLNTGTVDVDLCGPAGPATSGALSRRWGSGCGIRVTTMGHSVQSEHNWAPCNNKIYVNSDISLVS